MTTKKEIELLKSDNAALEEEVDDLCTKLKAKQQVINLAETQNKQLSEDLSELQHNFKRVTENNFNNGLKVEELQEKLAENKILISLPTLPGKNTIDRLITHCAKLQVQIESADEWRNQRNLDAERYNWLRNRNTETIKKGGVFAGLTPENVILNGQELDREIDYHLENAPKTSLIRARFLANIDDYRSINWPVKHPYWCSGSTSTHSIIVAYADNKEEIIKNWPEAIEIDFEHVEDYIFTDRFPKPEWFNPE